MTDSDFRVSLGDTPEDTWYAVIPYRNKNLAEMRLEDGEYVFSFFRILSEMPPEVPLDGLLAAIELAKKRLLEVA